jgi:hypothetical protein
VERKEKRRETQKNAPAPLPAAKPPKGGEPAAAKRVLSQPQPQQGRQQQQRQQQQPQKAAIKKVAKRKPSRSEVMVINCSTSAYADVMPRARKAIDSKALDIENIRVKWAITGGLIYEVASQNEAAKADALATALREVIAQRRRGSSVRTRRVIFAYTAWTMPPAGGGGGRGEGGGLHPHGGEDGATSATPSGIYSVWVQCPLASTYKISGGGSGQNKVDSCH